MKTTKQSKRRILSLFIALSIFFGAAPGISLPAWAAGGSWAGDGETEGTAYEIAGAADLARLADETLGGNSYGGKYFKLTGDIDLADWIRANSPSEGWLPVGNYDFPFSGSFDGQGHTISGLWTDRSIQNYQGLFGNLQDADVQNLRVQTAPRGINGRWNSGVLAGKIEKSIIQDCSAAGAVTGQNDTGGLVGRLAGSTIINSCFTGTIQNNGSEAGGLVGNASVSGKIQNCYMTGTVAASGNNSGGLVGWCSTNYSVENCYTSAAVSGSQNVGGLTGESFGSFTGCYWDTEAEQKINGAARPAEEKTGIGSGNASSGAAGLSAAAMKQKENFPDWDFSAVWTMAENASYPLLRSSDHADYYLNGVPGRWGDQQTLSLQTDGAALSLLAGAGPDTPVDIYVSPPAGSAVSITGDPGVTYENLYIQVYRDNTTLELEDLNITAPAGKNGLYFYSSGGNGVYGKIKAAGECTLRGGDGDSMTNNGIQSSYCPLIIEGRPLRLYGGKGTASTGGHGIRCDTAGVTIGSDNEKTSLTCSGGDSTMHGGYGIFINNDDITIKGDTDLTAQGGDSAQQNGGYGIQAFNVIVNSGHVTAKGGTGARYSFGIAATETVRILQDSVVIADSGKVSPSGIPGAGEAISGYEGVFISDAATVQATGHDGGYGIHFHEGGLSITGDSHVTATGGDTDYYNGGIAIYSTGGSGSFRMDGNPQVILKGDDSLASGDDKDGGPAVQIRGQADFVMNGGSLSATAGNSENGTGGQGICIEEQGLTVNNGQITAVGGNGILGGQGIYTALESNILDGSVTATGGASREAAKGPSGAGLRASDLTISGGTLSAAGGAGKQSSDNINDYDAGGAGIYAFNTVTAKGGSLSAHGGDAILGGYGMITATGKVTVSGGADLEVIGGTGTQNNGGVGMYVDFTNSAEALTVDKTAGNVSIRGGENKDLGESPSVTAGNAYIATGNIRRIDTWQGEIKNIPGGDDLYMLRADTSPLTPNAVFESEVTGGAAGQPFSYTYKAPAGTDGIAYLWLPEGQQTISSSGFGDGVKTIPADNSSAITLYNDFNITINYKENNILRGSETPTAILGGSLDLQAPEGYALAVGVTSPLTVDNAFLAGGSLQGCTVTADGKQITVDVPVVPVEIQLTVTYKTEGGESKGTQSMNLFYNTEITANDLSLPMGYALLDFTPFALNSAAPGITFDFNAFPKPAAAMDITVAAKEYQITATFLSGGEVGTFTFPKAYDSFITAADLLLPIGYKLPDSFAEIPVTNETVTIPPGSSTGILEIDVEPVEYTVTVLFKEGDEPVGEPYTVAQAKTIGQSITQEELILPAGYALQNFTGIPVDGALIATASGTDITVDVNVETQKIALRILYQNGSTPVGNTQSLNKDATTVLTEAELSLPFGYHLESPWADINMDDSTAFDDYQVAGSVGTAAKTVQVEPNKITVAVHFLQGTEDRGTQTFDAVDYGTPIDASALNGIASGYRLPDNTGNIIVSQSDQRFVFSNDTSAVLTLQVVPAQYTVTIQYNDKANSSYIMAEQTAYGGAIANLSNIPSGYRLDGFSGILLDSSNQNVVFDHQNQAATVYIALLPLDYTLTINYFDNTSFVGRQQITAPYDSTITGFTPPPGYETADGTIITMDDSLNTDHRYKTAETTLQVSKKTYSVQITYTGEGSTQLLEGKQVGDSILYAELNIPGGYGTVDFADVYVDTSLAASAVNGVISLEVPVTETNITVTLHYQSSNGTAGTQVLNVERNTFITADMLSVPYGYKLESFNTVTATASVSLDVAVSILDASSITVSPGQMILTLDKDREGYASAIVFPSRILDAGVTWESSNPAVAAVDAYGKIVPVAKGSAVIKAVSNQTNTVSGECMVTVLALGDPYAEVLPSQTGWSNKQATVTINTYADSEHTPGITASAKYKVTGSISEPAYTNDNSWTTYEQPLILDTDGTYYVHWYIENTNGKSTQGVSNAYHLDATQPEIISIQAAAASKNQIDLTLEAADSGSGLSKYAWYLVQDGNDRLLSTSPSFSHTGLDSGTTYEYKAVIEDIAGNRTEKTISATTNRAAGISIGGNSITYYTVTFDTGGGSAAESQRAKRGSALEKPEDPVKEGYSFTGWYTEQELIHMYDFSAAVTDNMTLYAGWEEHTAPTPPPTEPDQWIESPFINGYPDGTFGPDHQISRAETAQILYNLFGQNAEANLDFLHNFRDITTSHWAANAIAWAGGQGYLHGYPDGTLKPDQTITRAELTMLVQRAGEKENLLDRAGTALSGLSDITGHWAYKAIMLLAGENIIEGYPDGTFRPDIAVTRAETVTIIARLLQRSGTFTPGKSFADVEPNHWAYNYIMNAVNGLKK